MKEIRVGIVGFGFMGRAHTFGYKTIPLYYKDLPYTIRLAGVADPVPGVAEKAKEQLGFEKATLDPNELFQDPEIDCIDICTPNIFHKEGVLGALKAGKNVYCDKPLAASYAETAEIIEAAKKAGTTTQLAMNSRQYPGMLRTKQLIEEGRLGRILSFRVCYLHSGSVDPKKPIGWKQDKAMGGGGVLFDLGSHILDLMYFFLGEYEKINATTTVIYPERPDKNGNMVTITADDAAYMTVKMKNGALGTIEASKIATGSNDEIRFEIHGDKGAVAYNSMNPNFVHFYDNTVPDGDLGGNKGFTAIESVHRYPAPGGMFPGPKFGVGFLRGHVHSLYTYLDNVVHSRPGSPSFEDGAYIQYVMEQAYRSAEEEKWITL